MNIYECIYMIQMNDFTEMKNLIQYYRPMVTDIWADVFVRKTNTILCEKEEFYRHADLLLYHCIFEYRMEGYTLKNIAEELGLSASKVSFMFEKVKKWYTTIDS